MSVGMVITVKSGAVCKMEQALFDSNVYDVQLLYNSLTLLIWLQK